MATQPADLDFADQIFSKYIPLAPIAFNGLCQNVANPKTGDMAAAWWTGETPTDKNGMWSEARWTKINRTEILDKNIRVQIDFEPTHFVPISKRD